MKNMVLTIVALLLGLAVAGCAQLSEDKSTRDRYNLGHLDIEVRDIVNAPGAEVSLRVLASEERWYGSGVVLHTGNRYRVSASGQWKGGIYCNATGPSGEGTACFPPVLTLLRGIAINTLVGKIGIEGTPFPIGELYEFDAQADGVLYLRMNDTPGFSFDNSGFVDVKVALLRSTASPPSEVRPVSPSQTATPVTENAPANSIPAQYWAVVIGISDYADSHIPYLRYASADARSFYGWLVSPTGGRYAPARIKLLLNKEATTAAIKDALFNWLRQAIEEDVIIIYFAGHGSPDSPNTPQNLYLLPHDTKYESIASTGFPMWDVETALKRFIKAKRVIVIADACHSGGVGASFDVARRSAKNSNLNRISAGLQNLSEIGNGIAVLSASDDHQFSAEGAEFGGGHGIFTYYLLEGLKGRADYNKDYRVTLGELIPFLSEHVRRETQNAQSPTVAGRFDPALSIGR